LEGVLPPVGLLVLSGFHAALAITMKFLAISAKAVFAKSLTDLCHELEVIRQVVNGIKLGAQDLVGLLEVI
jgi:hypothetical protein